MALRGQAFDVQAPGNLSFAMFGTTKEGDAASNSPIGAQNSGCAPALGRFGYASRAESFRHAQIYGNPLLDHKTTTRNYHPPRPPSVTDVLDPKCYPCPDRAP